jgi:hypothetical protein
MQSFYGKFEMNRKRTKQFLTFRSGDLNPRFSVIFLPIDRTIVIGSIISENLDLFLPSCKNMWWAAHTYANKFASLKFGSSYVHIKGQ